MSREKVEEATALTLQSKANKDSSHFDLFLSLSFSFYQWSFATFKIGPIISSVDFQWFVSNKTRLSPSNWPILFSLYRW